MKKFFWILCSVFELPFFSLVAVGEPTPPLGWDACMGLFDDLEQVYKIDKDIKDRLPFFYNYNLTGGYFNTPSARMPQTGAAAFGGGYVSPYQVYGANFQMYDRIELSANYRVYTGISEQNFGQQGFGDDAERIGNVKIGVLMPQDGLPGFPSIAVGAEDFIGTKRFNSQYVVATREWLDYNLEVTLGWGRRRIKGWFGGIAWTPFRQTAIPFLKNLSLLAEYDACDYKRHPYEHPLGREVKSRINAGLSLIAWNTLQLSVSSVRGKALAASASLRYPLGSTRGLFSKIDDPINYTTPVDNEPVGDLRPEEDFVQELAYAFSDQGLNLYQVYQVYDEASGKGLWLKIINNRYRDEGVVRERIENVLAALIPSDIANIVVVVEADGVPCQSYTFRYEDLRRWRRGFISDFELETLAPMANATPAPGEYDAAELFRRKKSIWTFTLRPRLLTFFGSASGKFKYNIGAVASPEGYLFDEVYYKFQLSYAILSSMHGLGAPDHLNPSRLPNVRTDTMLYYQTSSVSMEMAYLQKGWHLGKGVFYRLAGGYFEPAYGGLATELLYYPAGCDWAIGAETAGVMKRQYHGVKFTDKARESKDGKISYVHFRGYQYFLNFYYNFRPLDTCLQVTMGSFLARDKGIRTSVTKYFRSGLTFSLWYTYTNAHDIVNGKNYHDKGFAFYLPLDMFLKQSSRQYVGYAMSAWLRDVGAQADTGKKLYTTISEERYSYR